MIYRLRIPEGIPYDPKQYNQQQLAAIVHAAVQGKKPMMLAPRTEPYSVTPEFSEERVSLHFVIPLMDGRGIFEIVNVPAQRDETNNRLLYVPGQASEREQILLPDDRPYMMLAAQMKERRELRIVDIIYYYPKAPTVDPLIPFSIN